MVVGFPPFYNKKQKTMFDFIQNKEVRFPDAERHGIAMSEELKDLISKLLTKDPADRIGTEGKGEEVKAHPWFSDETTGVIDFQELID